MPPTLGELQVGPDSYVLRAALPTDLVALIDLLAADQIGATREDSGGDLSGYHRAFETLDADPAHLLLVVVPADPADAEEIAGTLQLSYLPGLARGGALRAQIEAVRVSATRRGGGLGRAMITWAVDRARQDGCALVQLTSDTRRTDAHRFYTGLGFTASHTGFKMDLRAR